MFGEFYQKENDMTTEPPIGQIYDLLITFAFKWGCLKDCIHYFDKGGKIASDLIMMKEIAEYLREFPECTTPEFERSLTEIIETYEHQYEEILKK